jgi:hypothetical protein
MKSGLIGVGFGLGWAGLVDWAPFPFCTRQGGDDDGERLYISGCTRPGRGAFNESNDTTNTCTQLQYKHKLSEFLLSAGHETRNTVDG